MVKGKDNTPKRSKNDDDVNYLKDSERNNSASKIDVTKLKYKYNEKTKIALISIIASASLALFKLIIAVVTGSLGILSEAMHSGLDIMAAIMTLYAIRMAIRPPDLEHPYGYAKFESLTSLAETILLFVIAGWIFYDGYSKNILLFIENLKLLFSHLPS